MNSQMINLKRDREPISSPKSIPEMPKKRSPRKIILALLGLLLIWKAALIWSEARTWRAVFLTNNQVYFGRFINWPLQGSITLKDIYYLEVSQAIQPQGTGAPQEFKVVKLGNELHGPEDMMVIPKANILFWENLKKDANLVRTIESAK